MFIGIFAYAVTACGATFYYFFNSYSLGNRACNKRAWRAIKYGVTAKLPRIAGALLLTLALYSIVQLFVATMPILANNWVSSLLLAAITYISFHLFFQFSTTPNIPEEKARSTDSNMLTANDRPQKMGVPDESALVAKPSYCTHCGSKVEHAWKFCKACGASSN